ncbi:MAG: amidohydrolase [Balneolaceae bacterium]|nr:amidohydrolase [Balneolaceae bacterium]
MKKLMLTLLLACLTAVGFGQPTGSVHIKGGTVLTITDGVMENTDVLIEDGIITQIGQNLSTPSGVAVVDATGKYVMPGILDAHSHIAGVDINDASSPVTAQVKMGDSIDPNDVSIYRALAGGVTSIHLLHGSANVIGGESETLKLRYGQDQEGLKFQDAPRTIKFALGENPTRVHGQGRGIMPRTRMGVEQIIRMKFDEALDHERNREEYLAAREAYENGNGPAPKPVPRNVQLETVADILNGEILVHIHSYRADEILMIMRVFNDYGVENYTFTHGNEAFKVATELRKNGAHASVFADWWAYKFEVYYSTAYNASILNANDVNVSINSDSGELIRHLNHEAAKTVRYGSTSENDALRMITINPAHQLGVDDKVGSLEEGKHGDVSIWSGHPLSIYSINEKTFVDGVKYFDREEDPDDMRIEISPTTENEHTGFEPGRNALISGGRHFDSCMRDTEVFYLFGESSSK